MRTVVIVNQKGGCGKTTTAINLAGVFASRSKRALLVDLDPQSHCAAGLAIPEQRIDQDIADALVSDTPLETSRLVWSAGRNLDLIPSRTRLAGLEAARGGLATKPDKERRLARVLQPFAADYDVALIDCSPSIGLLTYNAITAATDILVPVETGFFSLQGAMKQAKTIESLERRLGASAPFWLLPTLHETNSVLAEDLLQELRRRFGDQVIPTAIRRDIKLKEAVSFGQPVIEYEPESTGARDYTDLADWLTRQWQPAERPEAPQHLTPTTGDAFHDHTSAETEIDRSTIRVLTNSGATSELAHRIAADDHPITQRQPADQPAAFTLATDPEPQPVATAEPKPTPADDRMSEIAALARKLRKATLSARPEPASAVATAATTTHARAPSAAPSNTVVLDNSPAPTDTPATRIKPNPRQSEHIGKTLLGVRQTDQGVIFVQPLAAGRQIAVAGDFNGWSTRANRLSADATLGVHQACVHLPPGRHRYRLVIDGRWTADPHNSNIEPNEFGETNSVIVVRAPASR
ncbi:MAG: AAA family ATPase [Planctomycetota bacterium]